jgi:hypothetical protein
VNGTMKHVARVFNDNVCPCPLRCRALRARRRAGGPDASSTREQVGVELVGRTGRNPQNVFVQLGCSKGAEQKMLHYVKAQCVGKPFSNYAMVRSLFWPRETDHTSFFCAGALRQPPRTPPPPLALTLPDPNRIFRARRERPEGRWATRHQLQPGIGDTRHAAPHLLAARGRVGQPMPPARAALPEGIRRRRTRGVRLRARAAHSSRRPPHRCRKGAGRRGVGERQFGTDPLSTSSPSRRQPTARPLPRREQAARAPITRWQRLHFALHGRWHPADLELAPVWGKCW